MATRKRDNHYWASSAVTTARRTTHDPNLGKAFYWQRLLDAGEVANATELARRFKLEPGWVAEVLRMTRLAPDIVQAIVEGRQPRFQ